jgi:hypothetical protein
MLGSRCTTLTTPPHIPLFVHPTRTSYPIPIPPFHILFVVHLDDDFACSEHALLPPGRSLHKARRSPDRPSFYKRAQPRKHVLRQRRSNTLVQTFLALGPSPRRQRTRSPAQLRAFFLLRRVRVDEETVVGCERNGEDRQTGFDVGCARLKGGVARVDYAAEEG